MGHADGLAAPASATGGPEIPGLQPADRVALGAVWRLLPRARSSGLSFPHLRRLGADEVLRHGVAVWPGACGVEDHERGANAHHRVPRDVVRTRPRNLERHGLVADARRGMAGDGWGLQHATGGPGTAVAHGLPRLRAHLLRR